MEIKPTAPIHRQPISQQFFNWVLVIAVAFLLGKGCWSTENITCCCCHCPKAASASTTSAAVRTDTAYGIGAVPVPPTTGRVYFRGPRGGCYYINSNGNKVYVDRRYCN